MFPDISAILGGLDPSQWSTALASAGIPPDALAASAQAGGPPDVGTGSPWVPNPAAVPGPGESVPLPTPKPPDLPQPGVAPPAAGTPTGGGPALVNALRGIQAPNVPQPQRVSTPSAPHPMGKIPGGDLIALLGHLGMLRGAQIPTSYQLPSTLGAALGGR